MRRMQKYTDEDGECDEFLNSLQFLQMTVWMRNCIPQMFHPFVAHFI